VLHLFLLKFVFTDYEYQKLIGPADVLNSITGQFVITNDRDVKGVYGGIGAG